MLLQAAIIFAECALSVIPVHANAESTLIAIATSYEIWNVVIPTFLEKTNAAARMQLQQIIKNESIPIAEVDNMIEIWAAEQEPEVQMLYHKAMDELDHVRSEILKAINDSTLSDAAKATMHQLLEVVSDTRRTMQEQKLKITQIRESTSENVSAEIGSFLMKHLFRIISESSME